MAREAGGQAQQNKNCDVEYLMSADALKALVALVRADQREIDAKLCDSAKAGEVDWDSNDWNQAAEFCASRIRARGETK
jgi:hypothetical protein